MREHDDKKSAGGGQENEGAEAEGQDPRRLAAMKRRHQQRQQQREISPEEKAQAGQFKEAMKRKLDGVVTTVAQATNLFQAAMLGEKLADKSHGPGDALIDIVVGIVFSELGSLVKNAVGAVSLAASSSRLSRW
jgi:hypothetical protein